MNLLKEMNNEIKQRNFVAKHARNMSGAGAHDLKGGKKAKRAKQKQELRRNMDKDNY
jgi:hypothetical protein